MSEDLGYELLAEVGSLVVDYISEDHSHDLPDPFNHFFVKITNNTSKNWYKAEFTVTEGKSRGEPTLPAQVLPAGKSTALYVTTGAWNVNGTMGFHLWYKVQGSDDQVLYLAWYAPQMYEGFGQDNKNDFRTDHYPGFKYSFGPDNAMRDQQANVEASIIVEDA